MFSMQPIGYVRSPYADTREVPKGLGAKHEVEGALEVLAEFEAGLQDIEGFSHLFVIWAFDRAEGYELVGTPPTDDRPHGLFATRSPRRPNPIGLTVVELLGREGPTLRVRGIDMLEGTPILDIKPYLSGVPRERLRRGWLADAEERAKKKGGSGPDPLTIADEAGVRFVEGRPGQRFLRNVNDASLLVEACFNGKVDSAVVYPQNLTEGFFDLSSGEAGAILQKLRTYGIRLAVVCVPGEVRFSSRFAEMAVEESRGGQFRICESREAARAWLSRATPSAAT